MESGHVRAVFVMWLDRRDMRHRSLFTREEILRNHMRGDASRAIFVDRIIGRGKAIYKQICEMVLGRIVCKPSLSRTELLAHGYVDQGEESEMLAG